MLTLEPTKKSRKIARIAMKNKKDPKHGRFIYIDEKEPDDDDEEGKVKYEIKLPKGGKLIPLPNKKVIERLYITAPSGAGKSTFVGSWLNEYKKMYKDDEIFVFSSIPEDEPLDKHDPIRIPLDDSILTDPLDINDYVESAVVFDDIDTIQDKGIRNTVGAFRDFLLEQGRHGDIRMLVTSHVMMNYRNTVRVLNEATAICFFPKFASPHHIKKWLKERGGVNKKQIKKILNLPSRWVVFYRTYPKYVLYERGAFLIDIDEDGL